MIWTNSNNGDYFLRNTQQNNGIIFYDGTAGIEFHYNDTEKASVDDT